MSGITVNAYPGRTSDRALSLTGTNDSRIATLYVSGVSGTIWAATTTSWAATLQLESGTNRFSIYGVDTSGNTTAALDLSVVLSPIDPEVYVVLNHFGQHGIPRALPQIQGEKNYFYRNRLMEVFVRPPNTTLPGIHYAINRELSLKYYPGFKIRSHMFSDGSFGATNATAEIDNTVMILECDEFFVRDELVQVDPGDDRFTLVRYPIFDPDFRLTDLQGGLVSNRDFEIDRNTRVVTMQVPDHRGRRLRCTYRYRYITSLLGKTLGGLRDELQGIAVDGRQLFDCTTRCASWPANGLFTSPYPLEVARSYGTFWWARLRAREMHNYWFRQDNLNQYGGAYDTKLEAWADEVESYTNILWKNTKLDQHYWNIIPEEIATYGTLPHLWGCYRGHWGCGNPGHDYRYTMKDYLRYLGTCPVDSTPLEYTGVQPQQFQHGTGTANDLMVTIAGFG